MDEYANDKHHKKAYKKIASDAAKPIIFLKRPEEGHLGQAAGTFATSPKELDSILTRAWQLIYNGTRKPLDQVVSNFMTLYPSRNFVSAVTQRIERRKQKIVFGFRPAGVRY